jgi:hypothetical protein
MPRFSILLSVRREFSFRARLLLALLALLQFIAPTWHVCEMGGSVCCPPKTRAAKLHCDLAPAGGSTPIVARCAECPPRAETSAQNFVGAIPDAHAEHCLAKLLLGMPWQSVAAQEVVSLRPRQVGSTPAAPRLVSSFDWPQPPSRGPPIFSS